jgi:hypothetical protein
MQATLILLDILANAGRRENSRRDCSQNALRAGNMGARGVVLPGRETAHTLLKALSNSA